MLEQLKPALFVIFCASSIAAAYASPAAAEPARHVQQQELLATISQLLKNTDKITGNFEQRKFISVLPQPLLSTGHFELDDETGLEWLIIKPIESRLVFDSQGIRQNQQGQTVWQVSNEQPGIAVIGLILRAILSADWETLTAYFSIEGTQDKQRWTLALTPKDPFLQQVVTHITLIGESNIETVNLFETSGDRTEIRFEIL